MSAIPINQKKINYIFSIGPLACFLIAFLVTLQAGPSKSVASLAAEGTNYATEDSGNLFCAVFLLFPFVISRFCLRKRGISLLEVAYFPVAVLVSLILTQIGTFPLSAAIPATFRYGSAMDFTFLTIYLLCYLSFMLAYLVLTLQQAKNLWDMYSESGDL